MRRPRAWIPTPTSPSNPQLSFCPDKHKPSRSLTHTHTYCIVIFAHMTLIHVKTNFQHYYLDYSICPIEKSLMRLPSDSPSMPSLLCRPSHPTLFFSTSTLSYSYFVHRIHSYLEQFSFSVTVHILTTLHFLMTIFFLLTLCQFFNQKTRRKHNLFEKQTNPCH